MKKKELAIHIRMEIAAIRQALRDLEDMHLDTSQIDKLLDRLNYLTSILHALEE